MEFIQSLDHQILSVIVSSVRSGFLTPIMLFITRLGNGGFIWLALAAVCLARKKTRPCGAAMLVALALGLLIGNMTIKPLVARPRPFLTYPELTNLIAQGGWSFPSGHSTSSFAAATAFFLFFREKGHAWYGVPCLILAALIALSRLYVCVHYPSDVLCGALLGIAFGLLATGIVRKLYRSRTQNDS